MTVLLWILFYILGCIVCRIIIIKNWESSQYCSEENRLLFTLFSWIMVIMYFGYQFWAYLDSCLWKWFKKK